MDGLLKLFPENSPLSILTNTTLVVVLLDIDARILACKVPTRVPSLMYDTEMEHDTTKTAAARELIYEGCMYEILILQQLASIPEVSAS